MCIAHLLLGDDPDDVGSDDGADAADGVADTEQGPGIVGREVAEAQLEENVLNVRVLNM